MGADGFSEVLTDDGRTLEVLTGGDPDGLTCLLHGGSPSAAVAYQPLDDAAAAQGLGWSPIPGLGTADRRLGRYPTTVRG